MKKFASLLCAAALIFTMSACSKNDAQEDTIILGTSADFAPYEFHKLIDGKDTILGFDVSLAEKIAEDMGKKLVIKDIAFESLIGELDNGTIDFVISGMNPDEKRALKVDFSDIYFQGQQSLVIRKADMDKYTSYESFKDQLIGVQTSSTQEVMCGDFFPDAKPLSLQAVTDEFANLINGKCEGVIVETAVAEGYVAENTDLMISTLEVYGKNDSAAVAVKKGDPDGLLSKINETIKAVTDGGDMDKWVEQAKADSQGIE